MAEALESLTLTVGGDISDLQSSFDSIPAMAQQAASQIDDAFASVPVGEELNAHLQTLDDSLKESADAAASLVAPAEEAKAGIDDLASGVEGLGGAAAGTTPKIEDTVPALHSASQAAHDAHDSITTLIDALEKMGVRLLSFEGLKKAAEETVTAFGHLQTTEIALGAITGATGLQVGHAIELIDAAANQLGIGIESALNAQQKLVAVGISLEAVPRTLVAIADGARAMNSSFDTVAQRFDTVALAGVLMNRSLVSMGISINDVGKAMGLADAPAKQIKQTFQDIGDVSVRADILTRALLEKFPDLAEKAAAGVEGSWQRVKNATHEAYEEVGRQLNGFAANADLVVQAIKGIETAAVLAVGGIKLLVQGFIALDQTLAVVASTSGKMFLDSLLGDWKTLAADAASSATAIRDQWNFAFRQMTTDSVDSASSVLKIWQTTSREMQELELGAAPIKRLNADFQELTRQFQAGKITFDQLNEAGVALSQALTQTHVSIKATGEAAAIVTTFLQDLNKEIDGLIKQSSGWEFHINDTAKALLDLGDPLKSANSLIATMRQNSLDALVTDENWAEIMSRLIDTTFGLSTALDGVNSGIMTANDAFTALGVTTDIVIQQQIQLITNAYDFIEAMHQVGDVSEAEWGRVQLAFQDAIERIAPGLKRIEDELQRDIPNASRRSRDAIEEIGQVIERDLSRAIGDIIFQTGKISDAFVKLGKDVVDIILNHIIKLALQPLLDMLDKVLAKIPGLGGILSDGGGGGTPSVPGTGGGGDGGGGAGALAGGLLGWAGLGVSIASGIVSGIQGARTNNLLGEIEISTRQANITLGGASATSIAATNIVIAQKTTSILDVMWQFLPNISNFLSDIDVYAANISLNLRKLVPSSSAPVFPTAAPAGIVVPAGVAGAAASPAGQQTAIGPVNITVNGAQDPQQTAQVIGDYLKGLSQRFVYQG